jgi:hypothetical protein
VEVPDRRIKGDGFFKISSGILGFIPLFRRPRGVRPFLDYLIGRGSSSFYAFNVHCKPVFHPYYPFDIHLESRNILNFKSLRICTVPIKIPVLVGYNKLDYFSPSWNIIGRIDFVPGL